VANPSRKNSRQWGKKVGYDFSQPPVFVGGGDWI
jgi:hypothetical protein